MKSFVPNGTTLIGTDIIFVLDLVFSLFLIMWLKCYTITADKGSITSISTTSAKVVYPDTSKMVIYDPKHNPGIWPILFEIWMFWWLTFFILMLQLMIEKYNLIALAEMVYYSKYDLRIFHVQIDDVPNSSIFEKSCNNDSYIWAWRCNSFPQKWLVRASLMGATKWVA